MSAKTILVVDDVAINLKLVAAALRNEGYRVRLASSAEEAWTTLKTMRPDLMLVDIRLPGMDGLELTRILRRDTRLSDVRVIAFTGASGGSDMQLAFNAGCDGYVIKGSDLSELIQRVRVQLGERAEPPAAETSALAGTVEPVAKPLALDGPEMEALRRKFLTGAIREVRRILEFLPASFDAAGASRILHQWIGSGGILGYPEIAEQARLGERLLAGKWSQTDLKLVLNQLLAMLSAPPEAAETPIPEFILGRLVRKRIALIGFSDQAADRVCAVLENARATPYLFSGDEAADSTSVAACAMAVVHVRPATLASPWLVETSAGTGQPRVFAGAREVLLKLEARVQARAAEFLIDGWQPEEMVMRLSFALARAEASVPAPETSATPSAASAPDRAPIVIADDDVNVIAVVRQSLEGWDMVVQAASNGPEALRLIRETGASVAVLDVNMPGMDGFEVLSALRREGLPVKVVMLTARQQEQDVVRGFELGADDYVAKPFNALELVARLKRFL